jgi:hypothetical protein
MAIYHFSVKPIGRNAGKSAVAEFQSVFIVTSLQMTKLSTLSFGPPPPPTSLPHPLE